MITYTYYVYTGIHQAISNDSSLNRQDFNTSNLYQLSQVIKNPLALRSLIRHIIELLCKNGGYSLAEKSENSLEAIICAYRYLTSHMARKTCFVDNCSDCLKILNILSLHSIRKHNKVEKTNNLMSDEEESKLIRTTGVWEHRPYTNSSFRFIRRCIKLPTTYL